MPASCSDLLILAVGSCRSKIFAVAFTMCASGMVNVWPNLVLNRCARSRVSSTMLPLVLTDRHPVGLIDQDVGRLQDRIGEQTDARVAARAPVFSLNCVIRLASPNPVMQENIQASSACSGTWLWMNSVQRSGSSPIASNCAADNRVRCRKHLRIPVDGDRVQVDDAVERIELVLQRDPVAAARRGSCRGGRNQMSAGCPRAPAAGCAKSYLILPNGWARRRHFRLAARSPEP